MQERCAKCMCFIAYTGYDEFQVYYSGISSLHITSMLNIWTVCVFKCTDYAWFKLV